MAPPTMDYSTFLYCLDSCIKRRGLTLQEVSKKVGIDWIILYRWIKGGRTKAPRPMQPLLLESIDSLDSSVTQESETFQEMINRLLSKHQLTDKAASKRLGVNALTIQRWRKGTVQAHRLMWPHIQETLGKP